MPFIAQATGSSFDDLADHVWTMLAELEQRNYFRSHLPQSWAPAMNLYETPRAFFVCMDLAGLERECIEVSAENGALTISGKRARPDVREAGMPLPEELQLSVYLMEIDSGRFHREIPIPKDVRLCDIAATYRRGYLWVTLPRELDGEGATP